ncbi:MAG: histidinol-phosphate transaminase [Candidatus Fluviicola riflensis]|nr:MAG: histidinol-phosphate transaminase [Candidatus Fluviicola riflensis]OGS79671.1 MAG: histidinol-phosphate transaminase [Candidatus Fluviicola riflensis]OGS87103.1 MAG: histidinol-phosphate transaminase [Fluviicola sp. RIFCSPHIGHO2_01_FULL_43_53]OGS89892.1 MAG: histidinol-phosphate transaminase [Fluviicola sp. RIFCSPHIGHO2_12_FULL_43_24]
MKQFIREDLQNIKPYSSARDEFSGEAAIWLDANENSLVTEYNRYPDPLQRKLKAKVAEIKSINVENLFIGNGSDEVLDLLLRLICKPFQDTIAFFDPSYGMYEVLARINGLSIKRIPLNEQFEPDWSKLVELITGTRVFIICNPNNPTGNLFSREEIGSVLRAYEGVVIIDEAYIDFNDQPSMSELINDFPNLIVVQTLSKAYGMAGLRVGMAIANVEWISALNTIKPPYNVSSLVQETALALLDSTDWKTIIPTIISERKRVSEVLKKQIGVLEVFPSEANFILFRVADVNKLYRYLADAGVVVRNRSTQTNCADTLRVTIGTEAENNRFLTLLKQFYNDEAKSIIY